MNIITKFAALAALLVPSAVLAAGPGTFTEACCVIAACCGLPCC